MNSPDRSWIAPWLIGLMASVAVAAEPTAGQIDFFEKKIRPVLVEHCYKCHSAGSDKSEGGLLLDTREGIRAGGESGPAVVPKEPRESLLLEAIRYESYEMPPDGMLPEHVVADFERWIKIGAPDPRDGRAKPEVKQAAVPAEDLWSLEPLTAAPLPAVQDDAWPLDDLDRFVLAPMESEGLHPVADAERATLLRRVYFDLIGLPPTPAEIDAFVADASPNAFETVVDRLLASPRFGERWGRHWLDVARYGESSGYQRNFLYPHAWRYRDWVVRAMNADMPYDRFIQEQIAGDLLPADTPEQAIEQTIATGFLAVGPKNHIGGKSGQFEMDLADDQINATTTAVLGLTVACARCHDHKFDPVPTKDYYALAGIFLSTETLYGTNPGSGGGNNSHPADLFAIEPDGEKLLAARKDHAGKLAKLERSLDKARDHVRDLQDERANTDELKPAEEEVSKLRAALQRLIDAEPPAPKLAMAVREAKKPVEAAVLVRGEIRNKGDVVPRGFLSALDTFDPPTIDEGESGRLELAEWLTSHDNPLTARVMVNRVWHHLFGRGIVGTVDNFGITGARPTHPKLLDHLAARFMDEGWSVKRLIRDLVLCHTYQLSSEYDDRNYAIDGGNVYLWRMSSRRLEAEAIRDAILSVSGQLDFAPPPYGSMTGKLGDGCLVRQVKPDPLYEETPHRSVYLPVARFFMPDMFQVFDVAQPTLVVGERDVTTVPSQTLFMMNNEFVVEQSRRAAERLLAETSLDDAGRVDWAYRLAVGRPPSADERDRAIEFIAGRAANVADTADSEESDEARLHAWAGFCQAMFASAEFRYVY